LRARARACPVFKGSLLDLKISLVVGLNVGRRIVFLATPFDGRAAPTAVQCLMVLRTVLASGLEKVG
jgi:hypothetical protein